MSLGMLGKYERLAVLGRGVSGMVFLAKDTLLNRQVALKEVDVQAGDLRRFLEEARVMDRLRHPNIVRVNGVDRIEDKVVIDMEYVRGKNLQEILRAEGTLPISRALEITIQILDALEYAHSMQTVHRDIKPANILIDRAGAVKLADFGLAEILATNAYACGAGTYAYMAPEDFAEENHSDSQSDIWAVAVTLFEMITGERPFYIVNPKSPFAWKRALETQEPRALRDLLPEAPPKLGEAIARGLARDKEQRFQTAGEFRDALELARIEAGYTQDFRPSADPTIVLDPALVAANGYTEVEKYTYPALSVEGAAPLAPRLPAPNEQRRGSEGSTPTLAAPLQTALPPLRQPRRGLGLLARRNAEARLTLSPDRLDFGSVRRGDIKQARIAARISNLTGPSAGRIVSSPDWITASPDRFDTARQSITLTVNTDRAPALGTVEDCIQVETRAGAVSLPVRVNVLKPRPSFREVALWFVPLFGFALAPAVITASMGSASHQELAPPAAASSLVLGIMLLVIAAAADLGIGERLACGVLSASMCFVLGLELAASSGNGYNVQLKNGMDIAAMAALVLGLLLFVQLLTAKRWKFWGFVLASLGLLLSGVCYHVVYS